MVGRFCRRGSVNQGFQPQITEYSFILYHQDLNTVSSSFNYFNPMLSLCLFSPSNPESYITQKMFANLFSSVGSHPGNILKRRN